MMINNLYFLVPSNFFLIHKKLCSLFLIKIFYFISCLYISVCQSATHLLQISFLNCICCLINSLLISIGLKTSLWILVKQMDFNPRIAQHDLNHVNPISWLFNLRQCQKQWRFFSITGLCIDIHLGFMGKQVSHKGQSVSWHGIV